MKRICMIVAANITPGIGGEDPRVSDVYRFSNTLLFIDSGSEFIALMF